MELKLQRLRFRVMKLVENSCSSQEWLPAVAQDHGNGGRQGDTEGDKKGLAHPVGLRTSCGQCKEEKARDGS
ncbi:MAG: hypothetical protein CBB78_007360 [Roseibacillus sp. TMED18]|nr:MAG: hypothetical protein CBB78_007360 [Roseibacillus sp. TMED18]